MESAFPTLKRGANKHCASGALIRILLLQPSIKPVISHQAIAARFRTYPQLQIWGAGLQAGCPGGARVPDMPHAGQEARMTADREVGATYLRIGSYGAVLHAWL